MDRAKLVDLKERIAISDEFAPEERALILDAINEVTRVRVTEIDTSANYLGRIETIWAALSVDEGGEGVCAAPFGDITLPLIAADEKRLASIVPMARHLARAFRKPVRLARFTMREDVEVYEP